MSNDLKSPSTCLPE
jgi:hypothetical protein